MLALNGVEVAESESLEDPELLMEVMEIREQMEEAETEDDINKLKQENSGMFLHRLYFLFSASLTNHPLG
jgi:DnaJ-domain-containing protein 1